MITLNIRGRQLVADDICPCWADDWGMDRDGWWLINSRWSDGDTSLAPDWVCVDTGCTAKQVDSWIDLV